MMQHDANHPNEASEKNENYRLIGQLRAKLFDPNVPSYLLNDAFDLLDWNPAFELIFPTNRFYRNMNVREFVDCLDNSDDAKRRGAKVVTDSTAPVDVEKLRYTSQAYGKMRFTKIASKVVDPKTHKTGWIVALNIDHVDRRQAYENDLKRTNGEQLACHFC